MPRDVRELVAKINADCDADPAAREHRFRPPEAWLRRMPLIHRAKKPETWHAIVAESTLRGARDDTGMNEWSEAVVFLNVGYSAYPNGNLAFVLEPSTMKPADRFTPFDTGAVARGFLDVPLPCAQFVDEHQGSAGELGPFVERYVVAHLNDSADYLTRPQRSEPDYPPYHRASSTTGDRRAWTIEVQVDGDVALDGDTLVAVLAADVDILRPMKAHMRRKASTPPNPGDDFGEVLKERIVNHVGAR